jgi:hypothetical protein
MKIRAFDMFYKSYIRNTVVYIVVDTWLLRVYCATVCVLQYLGWLASTRIISLMYESSQILYLVQYVRNLAKSRRED